MTKRPDRTRQTGMRGMGRGFGVGAVFGALAAWVATDINKPNSTLRRWIEIGRRKRERTRLENELKRAADEAAAVGEELIDEARRPGQLPPDEMPI